MKTAKMKIIPIFLVSLMMVFAGQAFSETIALFGPKVFKKEKGAPVAYTDRFIVPPGAGNFRLLVKNGEGDSGEVKNLSIMINGTEVISSSDLRPTPMAMKQITLQPENEIKITLKGQGGNAVFVQLDGDVLVAEPTEPAPPMPPSPQMPD
ncbi:hypothetical protein [Desulfuromonas sp. TF]|uniref:hypothetical protein n=1 Tax=Desulfuromonas sp. TF TaxID=1232410 RepID=UPI0003FF0F50|nr:hypothetical protein [Desulfuromonas sp. TF]